VFAAVVFEDSLFGAAQVIKTLGIDLVEDGIDLGGLLLFVLRKKRLFRISRRKKSRPVAIPPRWAI
jgi:hypothetical protein